MSKNRLRFVDFRFLSFAGIGKESAVKVNYPEGFTPNDQVDPANGVVVFFPPEHRYIEASGDQGVGKSSWLKMFQEACGQIFKNASLLVNTKDGDKKFTDRFRGEDGKLYELRVTRTEANLFQVQETEEGVPQLDGKNREILMKVPSAKDALKRLIGPASCSPLDVAAKSAKEQVEWVRSVVHLSGEDLAFEQQLIKELSTTYEARKKANSRTNELQKVLQNNDYFKEHEKWAEYFTATSFDNLEEQIHDINNRHSEYVAKQNELYNIDSSIQECDLQIGSLQKQIDELNAKLSEQKGKWMRLNNDKELAEIYLVANEEVVREYAGAMNRVKEASEFLAKKAEFEGMVKQLGEYNHISDESVRLTSKLDELRNLKKTFAAKVTPAVEGLEVCVPDEGDTREGIYWKGQAINMCCESEQWEWFPELCRMAGIRVIYIENISSLGSGSIDRFNHFIEEGGYVLATKMERGLKELHISFSTKIPK